MLAGRAALADAVDEQTLRCFWHQPARQALFAADISRLSNPEDDGPFRGMGVFEDLRALASAGDMPDTELAILAQAKGMLDCICATVLQSVWRNFHPHGRRAISGFATIAGRAFSAYRPSGHHAGNP